jgi:hypothetical protein
MKGRKGEQQARGCKEVEAMKSAELWNRSGEHGDLEVNQQAGQGNVAAGYKARTAHR